MRRIAVNAAIDIQRRRKIIFVPSDENTQPDDCKQEDEEEYERQEIQIEQIRRHIQRLPTGYRIIITLKLLEEMTFNEIAAQLHTTASTARSQYYRGIRKLKQMVEKETTWNDN